VLLRPVVLRLSAWKPKPLFQAPLVRLISPHASGIVAVRQDAVTIRGSRLLEKELEHAVEYSDAAFYHDGLNPLTRPIYFHRFVKHAAAHDLQFLGDAVFNEMQPDDYEPAVMTALRELDDDVLAREQYLDFLMSRRFRRTLLCRREVSLDHKIQPGVIANFYVASEAAPKSSKLNINSGDIEEFRTPKGASIKTSRPLVKAALLH